MNFGSIGDGARYLTMSRDNFRLKTELNTLSAQLSSGEVKDKAKVLKGDTIRFSAIDHSLRTVESKLIRNRETASLLTTMQRSLDAFDAQRGALGETLVKITRDSPQVQLENAALTAIGRFGTMVNTLNTEFAGRRLFAGAATDQRALISADDMLADLVTAIGGATDTATIQTAVDTWFDDPAGGYMTVAYQGDTGDPLTRRLDEATVLTLEARADNTEIRETLKGAALGALSELLTGLTTETKADLLFDGGIRLQTAAALVVNVQASMGFLEEEVERVTTAQIAEQTGLSIARNEVANDDPFETAAALQSVQVQLETHYQMTARLSQLSLANFLR